MTPILESLDVLIEEAMKKIIRNGKVRMVNAKRLKRPVGLGWKWDARSNTWKRQTAAEKQMRRLISKKVKITRRRMLPNEIARSNRLRKKSLAKRNRLHLK
jgi:hypothetical protein